jgi:hypothetical protein
MNVVSLLAERGGRGGAGEARADDRDGVLAPVGGVHQLPVEAAAVPLLFDRPRRDSAVEHSPLLRRAVPLLRPERVWFDSCGGHAILLRDTQ